MRSFQRALWPISLMVLVCVYFALLRVHQGNFRKTPVVVQRQVIPDRAHFVYVLENEDADLNLQFSQALSVFAVRFHWTPSEIFLHTNVGEKSILRARNGQAGKWSKLILGLPEMTVVRVQLPLQAANGVTIRHMEHKSDFVRVQAVRDYGGVYLDFDAHVLRDIRPLLRAGFRAVTGRQVDGLVISGTFMASKGAKLVRRWYDEMNRVYDGAWTTHSNTLVTKIGVSLVPDPGQVLILDRAALAPGDWSKAQCEKLWETHDPKAPETWLRDYSDTYILHAFSPHRFRYQINGYTSITPQYVFANQSNFARAVMPVAGYMLEQGLINLTDDTQLRT
ncbi:hypothetical protein CP533_6933 [Ophiocordyceps camponoti-saundersi (nom. inval.)]|nr:hypothetical protein CP533_6933 [Ophiocordyceps camponoti-saundersi (nom. inval.)]